MAGVIHRSCPQRGSILADATVVCQGPGGQPSLLPRDRWRYFVVFSFDIWGRWCETQHQSPR